ncbi:MAG: DNA polymerase [Bacteroidia bacterium]
MIFNLLSDNQYSSPFVFTNGIYTLIHTYNKAVELFDNVDYFENRIFDKTYWADDLDEFIKTFLETEFQKYTIKPSIFETINFEFIIEVDNELLCLKDKIIYSLDKRIALYFNEEVVLQSQKVEFSLFLKSIGILDFTFEDIIDKLKQYFNNSYKYYIPMLYKILTEQTILYDKEKFEDIIFLKTYLEQNKVYNVKSDFKLKRDNKGRYYQSEYTESLTGRIFAKGESLQTLPKEKRSILVADENCYFLEFDFSAFEFNILLDIYGIPKTTDPHLDVLAHLNLKVDRAIGKSINYSHLYGMSAERVVYTMKVDHNIDINIELLKTFPIFQRKLNIPINNGIIKTYFGRPIKIEKEFAALNNYIQGTAVDIFTKKTKEIIKLLPNDDSNKLILQNHDSILIQLNEELINETNIAENILNILKQSINPFSFEVEVKYGKVWSELI